MQNSKECIWEHMYSIEVYFSFIINSLSETTATTAVNKPCLCKLI